MDTWQDKAPGRGALPGPTLLQSRWPSRQRQVLQSSTQELPCGNGMPRDQQDLPNSTTVRKGSRVSRTARPWRMDLTHTAQPSLSPVWSQLAYHPGTGGQFGLVGSCSGTH
jgi:hypothetical protein